MLTKIALLSLLATLVAGDHVTTKDTARDFMLVFAKGFCGALGQDLGTDIYDPMECFQLAQEAGATAFSMGRKHRKGRCSVELLPFACDNYKQWEVRAPLSPSTHACHLADPDARVAWPPPRTPSVRRPPHP